jgi:hypothetical protein
MEFERKQKKEFTWIGPEVVAAGDLCPDSCCRNDTDICP